MAAPEHERTNRTPLMVVAWAWVTVPFAYGLYELVHKVTQLFTG